MWVTESMEDKLTVGAMLFLIGNSLASSSSSNFQAASDALKASLQLNPLLWCSWVRLCEINPAVAAQTSTPFETLAPEMAVYLLDFFGSSSPSASTAGSTNGGAAVAAISAQPQMKLSTVFGAGIREAAAASAVVSSPMQPQSQNLGLPSSSASTAAAALATPSPVSSSSSSSASSNLRRSTRRTRTPSLSISSPAQVAIPLAAGAPRKRRIASTRTYRNTLLPSNSTNVERLIQPSLPANSATLTAAAAAAAAGAAGAGAGGKSSTNNKQLRSSPKAAKPLPATPAPVAVKGDGRPVMMQSVISEISAVFGALARAFLHRCQYELQQSITEFGLLPMSQLNSPWVLVQIARCYCDLSSYDSAISFFSRARELSPHLIEGMDYYSSALWQQRRPVPLTQLAHSLISQNIRAPEAWIAVGNAFSLQSDHSAAVRFLQRATQLDPSCAYAYTLQGHELSMLNRTEQALQAFRIALRLDPRMYNAWFGLGSLYFRLEKFALAQAHFEHAVKLFPSSSVLLCHLALSVVENGDSSRAIKLMNDALTCNPSNSLARFKIAQILFNQDQLEEAKRHLDALSQVAVGESSVHLLAAQVSSRLGNSLGALESLHRALDLDPRESTGATKALFDAVFRGTPFKKP